MINSNSNNKPTIIKLNNVELTFNKHTNKAYKALTSLNIKIKAGQVFCLLGPNGSGKTTTINLINGLLAPTHGDITVLGMNPSQSKKHVLKKIALVPQETALYNDLTARENLVFHALYYGVNRREIPKKVDDVLAIVQLTDRQNSRVETFSGGMQRRLALARAMLTEPEILLLDEPTLGVDVQSRNAIWEQIRILATTGCTVILTTNYMEEADALSDEVLIIDNGTPVISGTPNELKQQLGQKQMVINFTDATAAKQAYHAVIEDYDVTLNDNQLTAVTDALATQLQLLYRLETHESFIKHIAYQEPNLQDVFLHFTGKTLRD